MHSKFNLIDEPWILVLNESGMLQEVSIRTVLLECQDYIDLAGEMEAQNAAVLRLLLAILYSIFSRYDCSGQESLLENFDDAIDRWQDLWELGHFPEKPVEEYLNRWHDKFWLIDDKEPFYQAESAKKGTEYKVSKLIGELSESNNKLKLFSSRSGEGKRELDLPEAARWLLYLISYDDNSGKSKTKGAPAPGAGWLGKIGQVYAKGNNLFQTLMLNLVFLKDGELVWGPGSARWELDHPDTRERQKIALPLNPAALLTLNSRRIFLNINEEGKVTGFSSLGGDFFDKENADTEQFTLWRKNAGKKNEPVTFSPKRHTASRQLWRDFSNLFVSDGEDDKIPGIVRWIQALKEAEALSDTEEIVFQTCAVLYGDSDYSPVDSLGDELTIHSSLLTDTSWKDRISNEIVKIDKAADMAGTYFTDVAQAMGVSGKNQLAAYRAAGKEALYQAVSIPFQEWLASIDPAMENVDEKMKEWGDILYGLRFEVSSQALENVPTQAYIGKITEEKIGDTTKKYIHSIPLATKKFYGGLKKLTQGDQK